MFVGTTVFVTPIPINTITPSLRALSLSLSLAFSLSLSVLLFLLASPPIYGTAFCGMSASMYGFTNLNGNETEL